MQRIEKRVSRVSAHQLATYLFLIWLSLLPLANALSQPVKAATSDSMPITRPTTFRWIVPAVLITAGLALSPDYPNSHFDRFYVRDEIQNTIHFRTNADNYLQYGPTAAWAALSLAGVKGRSKPIDRVKIGVLAHAISAVLVLSLKHTTQELRPDASNSLSFPSGHTANAFTGAGLLNREFGDVSPWISIGGYGMATTTGTLRMTNDKHWVSDVLVGAGIGLVSAEVAYYVYPWLKRTFKRHKSIAH